ncbi:unnamed protein product [Caenorhabditis brenneri]
MFHHEATSKNWEQRYNSVTLALKDCQNEVHHWKKEIDYLDQEKMRLYRELDYAAITNKHLKNNYYFLELDMNNIKEKIDRLESIEMRLINVVTVFAVDAMKIYQVETDCHLKLNTSVPHAGNRLAQGGGIIN